MWLLRGRFGNLLQTEDCIKLLMVVKAGPKSYTSMKKQVVRILPSIRKNQMYCWPPVGNFAENLMLSTQVGPEVDYINLRMVAKAGQNS